MKNYKCITKCPELDYNNEKHCISTESELEDKKEYCLDICPCGNIENLVLIKSAEEKLEKLFNEGWLLVDSKTLKTDINDDCLTIDNIKEFNE